MRPERLQSQDEDEAARKGKPKYFFHWSWVLSLWRRQRMHVEDHFDHKTQGKPRSRHDIVPSLGDARPCNKGRANVDHGENQQRAERHIPLVVDAERVR